MAATAFVIGFFTALGWWSANKVTTKIDEKPAVVIIQEKPEKEKN